MSITSQNRRNNYVGTNDNNVYDYTFKLFNEDHIQVKVRNILTGVETLLTIDDDYTVQFVNDSSGGTVTLVDDNQAWLDGSGYLDADYELSLLLAPTLEQPLDIKNNTRYFPNLHERQFDKLFQILLYQQDQLDRSIKLASSVDYTDFSTNLPEDILVNGAGKFLGINDAGTAIELRSGTTEDLGTIENFCNISSLTANRAVAYNGTSLITSAVTSTELGYLSGATSNIQTQINALGSGVSETTGSSTTFEITGSSTAGTQTYSSREYRWVKHGDLVFFECAVSVSSHTGTGSIRVPLPHTVKSGGAVYGVPILYGSMKPANTYFVQATVSPGDAFVTLAQYKEGSGITVNLGNVALNMQDQDATFSFGFQLWYRTDD